MRSIRHTISGTRTAIAAAILLATLLSAACANAFTGTQASTSTAAQVTTPSGDLVALKLSTGSSKVILPGTPTIARYQLFGTRQGGKQESLGSWTSLSGASVSVQIGTWDFLLDAYDASDKLVLEGSVAGKSLSADATLTFALSPIASGSGSVDVSLLWPTSSLVASVETSFGGQVVSPALAPVAVPPSSQAVTYANPGVASGNYLIVFKLKDAKGNTVCARSEWVLVRKDLASSAQISLAATDLNGAPAAPGEIGITVSSQTWSGQIITLAWSDTADNESGYRVESRVHGVNPGWQTIATLPAGSASYKTGISRGVRIDYRVIAFNSFGESVPIEDSWRPVPVIDFASSDAEIATVAVYLWDPVTLAFHGTATLNRFADEFIGGIEPTTLGSQLVQAYAYDMYGKIKAVAEATGTISSESDSIALTAKPVRLMGGNVQKTGGSIGLTPVVVKAGDVGIDCYNGNGMACDGLNLYIVDGDNSLVKRRVISSKAVALFAGAGAGSDEDKPGQSPAFEMAGIQGITTDGSRLYLALGNRMGIERLEFSGSCKKLFTFPYDAAYPNDRVNPIWLTTDGAYLYVADNRMHRLDLASLEASHLDSSDWSWKAHCPAEKFVFGGLTTNGSSLFWSHSGEYSMSAVGGDGSLLAAIGDFGGAITDGSNLYMFNDIVGDGSISGARKIDCATGATTALGNAAGNYAHLIATDGDSLFVFAN